MLKYHINKNKLNTQLQEIQLDSYELLDLYTTGNKHSLLVCYLPDDTNYKLAADMEVYVRSTIEIDNNNGLTTSEHNFSKRMKIKSVNNEKGLFTMVVDKYYDLEIDNITEYAEEDSDSGEETTVWYLHFDNNHLFINGQDNMLFYDGNGNILYEITDEDGYNVDINSLTTSIGGVTYTIARATSDSSDSDDNGYSATYIATTEGSNGAESLTEDIEFEYNNETYYLTKKRVYGKIIVYAEYTNTDGEVVTLAINCEYENPTTLRVAYGDELEELRESIYSETLDGYIVSVLKTYRTNPYWHNLQDLHVYTDYPICTIQVPISQKFETDLFLGYGIREEFVDKTIEESINSIVEMEKDTYIPVIWDSSSNTTFGEVYEIQFNLHFRQHRGDDWLVATDTYWNGVLNNSDEGRLEFVDEFFSLSDYSSQSDLLTYLDFTNDDVRYQKNKLKKSFLRLLFYDSTNPGNQNLLHYSTVFMGSGLLFKKYMKGIEDEPYREITYNVDSEGNELDSIASTNESKIGIRVNREPCGTLLEDCSSDDDIEDLRLSSRFVVEDKYDSDKCSEGFYLYLWKDNDEGYAPSDIYMKVEFNHAGYGRTIPFMMPYWDKNVDGSQGIKTFEEILEDWSDDSTKYGARKYLKYSYIHLKYRYDKENERHVYYLDDQLYGDDVHYENNKLVFNLYEAKMV